MDVTTMPLLGHERHIYALVVAPAPPGEARRPSWWAELTGLGLGYVGYEWLRAFADRSARVARSHVHDIYRAEQILHVNVERWLNHVLVAHPWDAAAAGYYYATGHMGRLV